MCIVKCIFSGKIIFMVHIPFKAVSDGGSIVSLHSDSINLDRVRWERSNWDMVKVNEG